MVEGPGVQRLMQLTSGQLVQSCCCFVVLVSDSAGVGVCCSSLYLSQYL
jgi:hypothetical protein